MRIVGVADNRTTFVITMKLKGPYYLNYNDLILTLATKVNNVAIISIIFFVAIKNDFFFSSTHPE